MKKTIIIGLIIVVLTVLIDQISKLLMVSLLQTEGGTPIVVIENFFKFQLYYNKGAAFSSFEGNFPFLMGMTVIATIIFVIMARWTDFSTKKFYSWGIYLMIGGMIGNFIDRVFNQDMGVVDFLSFTFFGWDFAVFNLADSFLVVGVICIIIDLIFFDGKREKEQKNEEEKHSIDIPFEDPAQMKLWD